jgi:hypothetical protein
MAVTSANLYRSLKRSLRNDPKAFGLYCSLVTICGILLMVLPAELITGWEAASKPELNLDTTFATLTTPGILSIIFVVLGFLLMVFDLVG